MDRPDQVPAALAALGWGTERVLAERDRCRAAGRPWPHPPHQVEVGAAQWLAARAAVVAAYAQPRAPLPPGRPGRDDERLLRDRPPHW